MLNLSSFAVIADIHGNLEALESILADVRADFPEVNEIYCAGDICGYGPNPKECIESIIHNPLVSATVRGNHDEYVVRGFVDRAVTPDAAVVIDWQIGVIPLDLRWELSRLPTLILRTNPDFEAEIAVVHGSPQYPLDEYILPDTKKQRDLFEYLITNSIDILILGHTHKPFVRKKLLRDPSKELLILNPGSVGQPRDGDPRASYAIVDLENMKIDIRRVDYDIESVFDKIKSLGLPLSLGNRLFQGM